LGTEKDNFCPCGSSGVFLGSAGLDFFGAALIIQQVTGCMFLLSIPGILSSHMSKTPL